MRCPFCAEEIQDAAIVCRYCGAERTSGTWKPPSARMPAAVAKAPKGEGTLRLAGACFLLTAAWELYQVTSAIPLAGAVRTGAVAGAYHVFFTAVYAVLGVALVRPRPWGWPVFLAGTAVYVADRVAFLLDTKGITAWLGQQASGLEGLGELGDLVDTATLVQTTRMATAAFLACWLGFAVYVYTRRHLFHPPGA